MSDEVLIGVQGGIGHIVLNRPQALNSLSLNMIQMIHRALDQWRDDPNIVAVLIEGAGDRAFCAGGDLRAIAGAKENPQFGFDIFKTEYTLNHKIYHYPKPYIAIMNGVTMGGGIGISIYGSHRIVTDSTRFAMPECGIGLFPDVGASWFLRWAPGQTGLWLGLTGHAIGAADALYTKMATHYLTPDAIQKFKQQLPLVQDKKDIDRLLQELSSHPDKHGILPAKQDWIDQHFANDNLIDLLHHLGHNESAIMTRDILSKHSPTSLHLTFESWQRAKNQSLAQVLETDFLLSQQCLRDHDFYEGIRAAVIDKDKNPHWSPARVDAVDSAEIARYFRPISGVTLQISV